MNTLDLALLDERRDCRAMAAALLREGFDLLAAPWLMRAARIDLDLRKRGLV